MVFSAGLRLRASAAFVLTSLVMLLAFVTLSTPKRVFPDISPSSASSFLLVMEATGDAVLSPMGSNRARAGFFPSLIQIVRTAAARFGSGSPELGAAYPFRVRGGQASCEPSVVPCSDMVSRK
ncbi:MAG: hypothetical protein LBQ56_06130 [Synergistaceae bacterium]|nr:hypothetical protein [Synergistaceae bacterium]